MHKTKKTKGVLSNENNGDKSQIAVQNDEYNGPVPSPDDLTRYNEMISDGANRFMLMAEKEQDHRHEMHQEMLSEDKRNFKREFTSKILGQLISSFVFLVMIIAGIYCMIIKQYDTGKSILTYTLIAVVGLFITGKLINRKNSD